MNLKVCSNFHFIRAIKDGLVKEVPNVDPRGRPGLTFKKLEDILGVADGGFTCLSPIDRSTRERATETTEFCCDGMDNKKYFESDYHFGEMTLKQLKKSCKTKKRKAAEPVLLTPKEEHSELEPDDDDLDLKQPLSSLKSKLLKSPKSNKKRAKKKLFAPNENALSRNSEQTTDAEGALQSNEDLCAAITVKVEYQEAEYSACQNMTSVPEPPISDQQVGFCGVESGKNFEIDTGREPICDVNEVSYDYPEHIEPIIYLPWYGWENTEVLHQEMEEQQSPVLHVTDLMRGGDVNTLPSTSSSVEALSSDRNQSPSMCNSSQTCPDTQQFVPQVESNIEIEVSDATADITLCCMEIGCLGDSCMDEDDDMDVLPPSQENGSPVLHVTDLMREEDVNTLPSTSSSVEALSPDRNQSPSTCNSSQTCPNTQQFVPQAESNIEIEVSDATADISLCCMEIGHLGDSCMDEDDDMDGLPPSQENSSPSTPVKDSCSTRMSHSCLSPVNEMVSMEDDSPSTMEKPLVTSTSADTALDFSDSNNNHLTLLEDASPKYEEKQSLVPVNTDAERKVFSHSYPHDTVSECSSSEIKDHQCSELLKPPERFPSTRKVISPTSQKKLCLAMKSHESLDDINLYKCKEKLVFGKQEVEKASLAGSDIKGSIESSFHPKGPEKVIRTKFTISPKQILKKPKNEKRPSPPRKGSAPKGCLEGPRLCRSLPRLSTGCTSVQACSESAIAFSQRQMHDIESLALKLMTELKSMKDIVEEKVLYESYRSPSLKNEADEVKVAIKTATKTEETARKWLSMMSRDCTRFCKIMKLTDNDAPPEKTIQDNMPQNSTHQRERKKICFADEAGGMLCDVKFFDDDLASKESRSETITTS